MVLREETVIQMQSLVSQMETAVNLNTVREIVGVPRHHTAPTPTEHSKDNDRMNKCMANNLFQSAYKGRFRKVKLILDRGYDINSLNNYGYSVLIAALHTENDEKRERMFRYLLDRGADPTSKDPKNNRSVLSWASLLGRDDQVRHLLGILKGDFDLKDTDCDGMTALHHATQGGHPDVVRTLVNEFRRYRISVDIADNLGLTPFLHAKRLGLSEISRILVEEGKASQAQSDSYTFRSGDEWSQIGADLKYQEKERRRLTNYEHAAILGRSKFLKAYQNPQKLPLIRVTTPSDRPMRTTYFVVKTPPPHSTVFRQRQAGIEKNRRPITTNDIDINNSNMHSVSLSKSTPVPSLSLLAMAPNEHAMFPKHFKHSELDVSKVENDIKHNRKGHGYHQRDNQTATIGSFMNALAEQNTSSFRPTAKIPTPEPIVKPSRAKRSTLAIIFGKDDKKFKKKKHGSARNTNSRISVKSKTLKVGK